MMSKPVHPSLNRLLRTCFSALKRSTRLHRGKGCPIFIKVSEPSSFIMKPGTWKLSGFEDECQDEEHYRRVLLENTVTREKITWSIGKDLGTSMAVTSVDELPDGTMVISADPTLTNHHSGEPL